MKLFKNRTVLGIFCIAVSLIICFAITPLVNAGLSKKVTIVRFNKQVNEGEEITRNMLDVVEVGNHNLPENVIRNVADVEGKYLTTTVYAGDYILTDKISDEPAAENKYLYSLNGEKGDSMNLILFCVFLIFSIGLFLLLAGLLRLPTLKTSRVMMDTGKEAKQLSKTLDAFYMDGAVKIAKYIRMNDYKKNRMANVLRASGLGMTPEVYTAYAYLKAGSVFLLIIPALYVFPLAVLFVILLGIMIYYKEIQKADEMLKEKREQIEEELYRFVSTITQELKNSRDVLSMLEHYKENAGAAFRKELDIVCADMRSSSYEAALTRFEARLNSPQLSDVVRGLIGVLRGDDGAVYFQMLTHDFKQTELQRLKAKAAKIPPKIRVYSFAMLMCFLATYFAIIIYEIIRSMGTLF